MKVTTRRRHRERNRARRARNRDYERALLELGATPYVARRERIGANRFVETARRMMPIGPRPPQVVSFGYPFPAAAS